MLYAAPGATGAKVTFKPTTTTVLLEGRSAADGGRLGFSDNYIPVLVKSGDIGENRLILARFEKIEGTRVVATPLAGPKKAPLS